MEKGKDDSEKRFGVDLPKPLEERLDYTLFIRRQHNKKTHKKRTYSEYMDSMKEKYPKSEESVKTWKFNTRPISPDKLDIRAFDILKYLRHAFGLDRNRVDRGQLANYIRGHEYVMPAEVAPEILELEKVGDGQWLRKLMPFKTYEEIAKRAEMVLDIGRAIDIENGGDGKNPFADERLDWKFRYRPRDPRNPFERYAFDLVQRLRSICGLCTEIINKEYLAEKIEKDEKLANPENRIFLGEILAFEKGEKNAPGGPKLQGYLPHEAYESLMERCEKTLDDVFIEAENKGVKLPMTKERYLKIEYKEIKMKINNPS